ncbi:MAG TPA: hypothetical protein PKI68_08315 [Pontiellaceae bacterium]|nr:hypothetical protein [Pontiellaceae bacterium]
MKDVFVSRPTWVSEEFEDGLNKFIGFLKSKGLNPRTLGSTDYPTECPLDEVLGIMKQCCGAIILGYPQITISKGSVKNKVVTSELTLATEWNHIEAGLAHARGIPLLIIHHKNISRGIFDRGTMPNFIHSIDLANASWILSEPILGAFKKWETDINSQKPPTAEDLNISFDEATGTLTCDESPYCFCHKCYHEKNNALVPLTKKNWGWRCQVCKEDYKDPNYIPPPPRSSRRSF